MVNTKNLSTSGFAKNRLLTKMAQATLGKTTVFTETETRLGQLLLLTGLVSAKHLNTSLQTAETVRLPLGVVLLMNEAVDPRSIDRAIHVQQLIHKGLPPSIARMVLRYATAANVTAEEAIEDFSLDDESTALDCWMAHLVIECEMFSKEELDEIKGAARKENRSWIFYAAEQEILSLNLISCAMHSVVLMDLGLMSHCDVVSLFKAVKSNTHAMSVLLRIYVPDHKGESRSMNVLALLLGAGLVSERTALDILSCSYRCKKSIVALLEDYEILSEQQLDHAFTLMRMITSKGLTQVSAIMNLKSARESQSITADKMLLARWQTVCA